VVNQAVDDADTLIVKTALKLADNEQKTPVTVVANDTNILVLLLHHFKPNLSDIYLMSQTFSKHSNRTSITSIRHACEKVGSSAAEHILVIHAISGCDTTSSLFGHGKATVWRKLSKSHEALPYLQVMSNCMANLDAIIGAGVKLLALIYGATTNDKLNVLRYRTYMDYAAISNQLLKPERLPPTENAAKFHCLRAHLQVVMWKQLTTQTALHVEDWGWQLEDSALIPVATDIAAAPDDLLKVVRCKCRSESRNPCSSTLCSCRKHGLQCVAACKNCCGVSCDNASTVDYCASDNDTDTASEGDVDCYEDPGDDLDEDTMEYVLPWIDEEIVYADA
jgi:hypothetical protein